MKNRNRYRNIQLQLKKIEELEKKNHRFRRVYSEYEDMANRLNHLDDKSLEDMPDDFIDAMIIQTSYLEEEIEDWLRNYKSESLGK